jgi:anti-sigma factor RsiW
MKTSDHPDHGRLIDYLEGELAPEAAVRIEAHLAGCEVCRAFVRSVESTFSVLEADPVPEPPQAFFDYLAGRARARASRSRKSLLLRFLPGMASAVAAVVLMWWLAGTRVTPVDGVDMIMAEMTTGEIVEAVSAEPAAGSLLIEDSAAGLGEIEAYLLETESIYDLLDSMNGDELERLAAYLERSMSGDLETSGHTDGYMRKGC